VLGFYIVAGRSALLSVLCSLPIALAIVRMAQPDHWGTFFSEVILVVAASAVGFWIWILDPSDRKKIMDAVNKLRGKPA
jgi:ABC-type Fe3+ transport system permease subunit